MIISTLHNIIYTFIKLRFKGFYSRILTDINQRPYVIQFNRIGFATVAEVKDLLEV